MKKVILSICFSFALLSMHAQEISENAIGFRLGDNKGFGGEINYQRSLGDNNRLEFGLGWRSSDEVDAFKLVGLYEWIWNIDGGFNWYAGAGGGIGSWSVEKNNEFDGDDGIFLALAGNIGIEYNFPGVPILLSLDLRPEIYIGDEYRKNDSVGTDIGLGIRYQF
uniref:hypothetical protein n=1 Tax=Flavobacterium sp. TaxID=239 RepID=UPI00404A0735